MILLLSMIDELYHQLFLNSLSKNLEVNQEVVLSEAPKLNELVMNKK